MGRSNLPRQKGKGKEEGLNLQGPSIFGGPVAKEAMSVSLLFLWLCNSQRAENLWQGIWAGMVNFLLCIC